MHGESSSPTANRYAVSPAIATQADYSSRGPLPYAGFWKRAVAYIIDYFIVMFLVGICITVVAGGSHGKPSPLTPLLAWIAVGFYYVIFESSSMQATPGKRAMDLKVTDLQGERIGFGRALGRMLGHILSFMTLSVGFAMAVFTERRQTLHDKMAGTLVVSRVESPEDIAGADIAPPECSPANPHAPAAALARLVWRLPSPPPARNSGLTRPTPALARLCFGARRVWRLPSPRQASLATD